jgi:hypothetical protein
MGVLKGQIKRGLGSKAIGTETVETLLKVPSE